MAFPARAVVVAGDQERSDVIDPVARHNAVGEVEDEVHALLAGANAVMVEAGPRSCG